MTYMTPNTPINQLKISFWRFNKAQTLLSLYITCPNTSIYYKLKQFYSNDYKLQNTSVLHITSLNTSNLLQSQILLFYILVWKLTIYIISKVMGLQRGWITQFLTGCFIFHKLNALLFYISQAQTPLYYVL